MKRKRLLLGVNGTCLLALVACEQTSLRHGEAQAPTGAVYAATQSALPTCNPAARGTVYYVGDSARFYYCDGKQHRPLDLQANDGADGTSWVVNVRSASPAEASEAGCAGGVVIASGPDANRDGHLDGAPASWAVVCDGATGPRGERGEIGPEGLKGDNGRDGSDGAPGAMGLSSLIRLEPEPAGPNCEHGGQAIHVGLDQDRDGDLSVAEISDTTYLCKPAGDGARDEDHDGYTVSDGDCDDTQAAVNPGALEIAGNGVDDDCDPSTVDSPGDDDGDGWAESDGDCDDSNPLVNPGAFEILGNGIDDDCSEQSDDTTTPSCSQTALFESNKTGTDLARAMELCQFTTAEELLATRRWGVISAALLRADGSPGNADLAIRQTAVTNRFGNVILPFAGTTMAGLSTGRMRDANDTGFVAPGTGTDFRVSGQPPAAYLAVHGSLPTTIGCSGSCPSGSGANDSANLRLTIRVPTNARGFSYRSRFFSAEFGEWSCSPPTTTSRWPCSRLARPAFRPIATSVSTLPVARFRSTAVI